MITGLSLENFKCFKDKQQFSLSNLNIFTGFNGRGKSSVFQSLLLLSQSFEKYNDIQVLSSNGCFVSLDRISDLLNKEGNSSSAIRIGLSTTEPLLPEIKLGYIKAESDWKARLCELTIDETDYFKTPISLEQHSDDSSDIRPSLSETYPSFRPILSNFYYISASRLGPSLFEKVTEEQSSNPVGVTGENRLSVLLSHKAHNGACFGKTCSLTLKDEVQKWASYILDGISLNLDDKSDSVLRLEMKNRDTINGWLKPVNMGFGYSYILSVIIDALIADKGSVLFVENPEAHLHPIAQARLMQLLCKVAMNGVQVNIETHSEHIVTSARLYCLQPDKEINQDDVEIYFFDKDFSIKRLTIDEYGQIQGWPKGFFDLQEEQLTEILNLGLLSKR